MLIKKVKLHNIRSYKSEEIEFPEGSTVLSGDIGTGKTSVLLAIEFALFGLQPGQKGSSLLRNGKNEGSVSIELEIDDKNIIIERGLKRKKTVNQSYAKISLEGEEKETSITELKSKVLSLLQYPKEFARKTNILYRFTVYTPQEQMRQIILETPDTRLNTLRHIFGIDKYRRIRENTDLFTMNLREQIREKQGQIKDLEEIRKKLEEKKKNSVELEKILKLVKEELEKRKQDRKKLEEEVKEVEEKIQEKEKYEREAEKTKIMLMGKRELMINAEKEIFKLAGEIKEAKKTKFEEKELENKKNLLEERKKQLEEKNKIYLELLSKIRAISSKISEAEKLKEQISKLDLCPTCLQTVDEDYKKNIEIREEENISKNKERTKELEEEKEQIIKEIEKIKQEAETIEKNIEQLNILRFKFENLKEKENKITELEKQKISTEKDVSLLEKQVERLKESVSLLKKYDNVYETKKKKLEELLEKEKEKEIETASIKKEQEMSLNLIKEIQQEIGKKEVVKKELLEIMELEDWLSSSFLSLISLTEKNIMFKLKEQFSKLFNEWFNILVPEIFSVHLDEDFTPVIEQQDYFLDYSFLSGGERTAIALAYRLALNQVINSLLSKIKTRDLVILDEPTDGFSEQQLDKMRDVLNELQVRQLIIVSHEAKIESFVENIIKFTKAGGITKVEV